MRSRMDKYYKDESVMQRTSKNDSLYEELYKEKKEPTSNVTVLDNIDEIDITKIKEMLDSREENRKRRKYQNLMGEEKKEKEPIKEEYLDIDDSNYDINQIIEKKKIDLPSDTTDKLRKLDETIYNNIELNDIEKKEVIDDIDNTMSKVATCTDLFANLKEGRTEKIITKEEKEEQTFYTNTDTFTEKDFSFDDDKEKNGSTLLIILTIVAVLVAVSIFVWFKFFK